jgi:spoIIIJ-associated protein
MSAYKEFTGKTPEEALKLAREEFGVEMSDLDFEILSPGSRGVLGMGAEPARILAAPRSELGGSAPKREAAASTPLPPAPPRRDDRPADGRRDRDRGPRDRGPRDESRDRPTQPSDRPTQPSDRPTQPSDRPTQPSDRPVAATTADAPREDRPPTDSRSSSRGRGGSDRDRGPRRSAPSDVSASEAAEVAAARGSLASERAELEAAEASPEALAAGQRILETLMGHLGFDARVEVAAGETSRLNVVAQGEDRDALGALIGRKGERLSALQHLVNLMLSKEMGQWTRVLVDVEDYRGRRERQLRELATRAAARVVETGKMLQLEPMPALERRWIHLTLRDHPSVATQSIGEEPNRRVVLVPRG